MLGGLRGVGLNQAAPVPLCKPDIDRAEFGQKAKHFFNHVQGMKNMGRYRSRSKQRLSACDEPGESADIWDMDEANSRPPSPPADEPAAAERPNLLNKEPESSS